MSRFGSQKSSFWIVISEQRGMSDFPSRHFNEASAVIEAERLARMHLGAFYVFEAKARTVRSDIITEKLSVGPPF